ncbi:hypothetical protein GGI15_001072 [Coemansia interrupta]|uniref:Uncharacterized protein n=1 Tax=Coemansia interrupta TaxID=1126814 RepID=A0A9W8LMX7_9FUNG|nr:hypothetical protein GGI15_001072 [Coemansia interrupta]
MPETNDKHGSKRSVDAPTSSSKRARIDPKEHTADCQDSDCHGCASGAVAFDTDILDLSAKELLSMAEHEEAEGSDRSIVTKLYETSIEKFAGESTLDLAWALLRSAEYVDYDSYATEAIAIAEKAPKDTDEDRARAQIITGRARVLNVCLNHANWQDKRDDDTEDDDNSEYRLSVPISDVKNLEKGLADISESLGLSEKSDDAVNSTLAFFSARYQRHALIHSLRARITNSALDIGLKYVDWTKTACDDVHIQGCRIAVWWAMAVADTAADSEQDQGAAIEARIEPISKYLELQTSNVACCKLRAQMLIVLSSVILDEDRVVDLFDMAIDTLHCAHKIDPEDQDVISQLADLGVEM